MANGNAYNYAIREIVQYATDKKIDMIVDTKRVGSSLDVQSLSSWELVAPVRKPGKLPREVISADWKRIQCICMHADAHQTRSRRVSVIDLLALVVQWKQPSEMIENSVRGLQAGLLDRGLDELKGREKRRYDYKGILVHYLI